MFLRTLYDEKLAAAAYLIGCERTGEAIVIDPERDVDRYVKLAAERGMRITAVAETHIHADFLSGARELGERGAVVYVSGEGGEEWTPRWLTEGRGGRPYEHKLLRDGDTFRVGNIELKALHTPGHTPEHVSYQVTDLGGGADAPIGVATGDFVFVGDVGRPDLLESAAGEPGVAAPSAQRLYGSVRRFAELPDFVQVWPGHGAGSACGKALGAVPQSTVGYERRFNPAIRAATDEKEFVDFILEGQPEPPLYFDRMKRQNRDGPPVLGELPSPQRLTIDKFADLDARKVAILDTRPWKRFREAHKSGSLHAPMIRSFTTDAGSMVRDDEDIALVVEPERVEEVVRDLVRIGLDRIIGWIASDELEAGLDAMGEPGTIREVEPELAQQMLERGGAAMLDVRRATERSESRIPGTIHVPVQRLAERLDDVPREGPVLVQCRSGARSARAASLLARHGIEAINLKGGILGWTEAGAPVEK